jgi:predicted site-specific integrase-resolvase
MRLHEYAGKAGIQYRTAWNHFKRGEIPGAYQLHSGVIVVPDTALPGYVPVQDVLPDKVAIYARVLSSKNRDNLERQAERLQEYPMARGYPIANVVKEVRSGVNDNRRQLARLLRDKTYNRLIVEHKDRLTRFGFNYLEILFAEQGRVIEVVNEAVDGKEDLMEDFVSIITSFVARLYGLRRSKRRTEKLIAELKEDP